MGDNRIALERSFEELGVSIDEPVLRKCIELCQKYDVTDAEDFVDSWVAYSVSHFHGENPTLAHLSRFERDEFARRTKDDPPSGPSQPRGSLRIYEAGSADTDPSDDGSILSAYNASASLSGLSKADKRQTTPEHNAAKRSRIDGGSGRSPQVPQSHFSPASFSPTIATPNSRYSTRTNAGEVVLRFNEDDSVAWTSKDEQQAEFQLVQPLHLTRQTRYMCFDLVDMVEFADETTDRLGRIICSRAGLDELVPTNYKQPSAVTTLGRIACDSDGRLNAQSVILEGCRDVSDGRSVRLDLSNLHRYSLFPGMVAAVRGVNVTGDVLSVTELWCDAGDPPNPLPSALAQEPLSVIVAAGPLTHSDSMNYQPLLDLVDRVSSAQPHLLILTGPFIDVRHSSVTQHSIAETYQTLFAKLVDQILKPLEGTRTHVALIASHRDCHSPCVYPTPPLPLQTSRHADNPRLHLLPDPCVMNVNGVHIGVTATDVLMHLGKEEVSNPPHSADRLSRLAHHVISQKSFHPLSPSPEDLPLDPALNHHVRLEATPHVLVMPSDLRYFIKEVAGCTVVNPERLAKGVVGGTFARLLITDKGVVGNVLKI